MILFRRNANAFLRREPKKPCIHRGPRKWLPLDARVNFTCRCPMCPSSPGACIEDWRTKQVTCSHYKAK